MRLEKLLRAILLSRFEPIETVLAVGLVGIGITLLLPTNVNLVMLAFPFPQVVASALFILAGVLNAILLSTGGESLRWRKHTTLVIAMCYLFITLVKAQAGGIGFMLNWLGYAYLTLCAIAVNSNLMLRWLASKNE
jgi:hypothetical protein